MFIQKKCINRYTCIFDLKITRIMLYMFYEKYTGSITLYNL